MIIKTVHFIRRKNNVIHEGKLERGILIEEDTHLYDENNIRTGAIYDKTKKIPSTNDLATVYNIIDYDEKLEVKSKIFIIIDALGNILQGNEVWVYEDMPTDETRVIVNIPLTLLFTCDNKHFMLDSKNVELTIPLLCVPFAKETIECIIGKQKIEHVVSKYTPSELLEYTKKFNDLFKKDIDTIVDNIKNDLKNNNL